MIASPPGLESDVSFLQVLPPVLVRVRLQPWEKMLLGGHFLRDNNSAADGQLVVAQSVIIQQRI